MGARQHLRCAVSLTAAVISMSSLAAAQPAAKDSIVTLRQDLEVLRGQLAMLHGRDSQHDVDLAELGRRIGELEARAAAVEAVQRAGASDQVGALRTELYGQLAQLQSQLQALLESPAPTQVDHEGGFVWTSEDEAYQLRIGGNLQSRWSLERGPGAGDAGFALRRARVSLDGTGVGGVGFRVLAELSDPALVEGWLEYNTGELSVRAGRDRVPFLRSGVMPEEQYAFAERALVTEALGRDRDLGVQLRFHPRRVPVQAVVMVANGGPDGAAADVPVVALRTTMTPLGPRPDPGAGDLARSPLSATIGFSLMVDAPRVPDVIYAQGFSPETTPGPAGTIPIVGDLDGDGTRDRIVVATTGVDLTIRRHGLELAAEGVLRFENWGDLLAVNSELADAVGLDPMAPSASYLAGALEATYMAKRYLMVGARLAGGQVPFVSTRGPSAIPPGRTMMEVDGMLGLYRSGTRVFGVTYRYVNHGARYRGAGDGPIEHAFIAEAQVVL